MPTQLFSLGLQLQHYEYAPRSGQVHRVILIGLPDPHGGEHGV